MACWCYSIEHQQRGMPHAHILISLVEPLDTPEKVVLFKEKVISLQVNKVVWGHIPKLPPRTDPDYEAMKTLRELVRSLLKIFQQAGH